MCLGQWESGDCVGYGAEQKLPWSGSGTNRKQPLEHHPKHCVSEVKSETGLLRGTGLRSKALLLQIDPWVVHLSVLSDLIKEAVSSLAPGCEFENCRSFSGSCSEKQDMEVNAKTAWERGDREQRLELEIGQLKMSLWTESGEDHRDNHACCPSQLEKNLPSDWTETLNLVRSISQ